MEDRLILLIGASGSGKTTLAKELEKEGYNIIHSYTTREPREEGEWGHKFIPKIKGRNITCVMTSNYCTIAINGEIEGQEFLEPKLVPYIYYNSQVIAHKKLYNEHYWATKDQYQDKGTSIYVIDPEGAEQVRENVKDAEVLTIFLMADEETRFNRMLEQNRAFGKSVDRVMKDREIFKRYKTDYVVDGDREIEEVLAVVKEIINGQPN